LINHIKSDVSIIVCTFHFNEIIRRLFKHHGTSTSIGNLPKPIENDDGIKERLELEITFSPFPPMPANARDVTDAANANNWAISKNDKKRKRTL
jgi:hypothetical protein